MKKSSLLVLLSLTIFSSGLFLTPDNMILANAVGEGKKEEERKIDLDQKVEIPTFENQHLKKGDNYFKSGHFNLAYEEYFVAVRLNPTFWQGFRGIGNVFLKLGNLTKAINNYLKAISIVNPTYVANTLDEGKTALKEGDLYLAIAKFQKILAIPPEAGLKVDEAVQLIKDDKKSQALKLLEAAQKIVLSDPNAKYADLFYKLGNMYYEKKKYPDAIKAFAIAVRDEPAEFAHHYALGNSLYKQSNKNKKNIDIQMLKRAISSYQKAHALNERDADTMFNLGSSKIDLATIVKIAAATKEKEYEKTNSIKTMEEVDKLNGEVKKYATEAIELLEKATSFNPSDVQGHIYLGDAYVILGELPFRYLKAVDEYKKAMELDSSQTQLYFSLGVAYYLASSLQPRSEDLPITKENAKLYVRFGKKFFKADMLTYAQDGFNNYTFSNLRGKNLTAARKYILAVEKELTGVGFRVPDRTTGR